MKASICVRPSSRGTDQEAMNQKWTCLRTCILHTSGAGQALLPFRRDSSMHVFPCGERMNSGAVCLDGMRNHIAYLRTIKLCVSLALTFVFGFTLFAGEERATGFRPPRGRIAIERQEAPASGKTLLAARPSASSLPTKWDSRDEGWVSSVKRQGNVGACWSFAACAVLETQLLKAGRGEWDLSEKNMVNLHGFKTGPDGGGNDYYSLAYLMRWGGAVAESNDVYKTSMSSWTASPRLKSALRVQNVVWVPGRNNVYDNNTLKKAIKEYGAVSTSIYWGSSYESTSNYYCSVSTDGNHAITAVGWDDSYPASNFKTPPAGNGAFLIKNSWGTGSGDKGFYWVSYYDKNFAMAEGSVFIPATEDEDYDAVYGYDTLGAINVTGNYDENTLEAAVFTSAWNEEIAAVGVYSTIDGNTYEVSVWTNVTRTSSIASPNPFAGGALASTVSGTMSNAGFATIPLPSAVKIADGTNFAVVYRQTGRKHPHIFCCSDSYSDGTPYAIVEAKAGNTYWGSVGSGVTNWTDLAVHSTYPGSIACLKAYTRSTVAANDAPAESADGSAALEWLAATNETLYAETAGTFGAFAGLVGANGRSLYASWLAGFDPADPNDGELKVAISVMNGVPHLTWTPDLGSSARTYTILGSETISSPAWEEVTNLEKTKAKYFKVTISPP